MANASIDNVLNHAHSSDDKLLAQLYQMLCKCDQTFDYAQGAMDGVRILNLHGFDIPPTLSKAYMVKEEMKLKLALHNRSYHSCLTELHIKEDPIFHLFRQTQKYSTYSSNDKLTKILSWKAIRYALQHGMSKEFPTIMVGLAALLAKQGEVKTAQEFGHLTIALSNKILDDAENCAFAQMIAYSTVVTQLQSFRSVVDPLHQNHKALKLVGGDAESTLGSIMAHFECYFAAGLELGPLLESKLILLEQLSKDLERMGFMSTFQIYRQFALNLRKRSNNPTELEGDAFHEEKALANMNGYAHKMALRDSSSMRLQLAFIFWDEACMLQMLTRLQDYPLSDIFM